LEEPGEAAREIPQIPFRYHSYSKYCWAEDRKALFKVMKSFLEAAAAAKLSAAPLWREHGLEQCIHCSSNDLKL